jgi:hypothetical protein
MALGDLSYLRYRDNAYIYLYTLLLYVPAYRNVEFCGNQIPNSTPREIEYFINKRIFAVDQDPLAL